MNTIVKLIILKNLLDFLLDSLFSRREYFVASLSENRKKRVILAPHSALYYAVTPAGLG
jgi:hypothetical protein